MIVIALAAALAAAPTPAPTAAFDQQAMARYAAGHADVGPRRLVAALRDRLAADPVALAASLSPYERTVLQTAVGPIDADAAPLLRSFAAGAMVRETPGGVTGLYNPLSDVWLVLSWLKTPSGPALLSANLVDGAALRADDRRWWNATGSYADAIAGAWKASAAAFDARLAHVQPVTYEDDADIGAIVQRLARQEATVRLAASDAAVSGALERGRQAFLVRAGQDPGASPSALQLAALPAAVRRSARLALVVRRPDGVSGAYVTPAAPGLLFFIDLDAGHAPRGVTVVNLSETQP